MPPGHSDLGELNLFLSSGPGFDGRSFDPRPVIRVTSLLAAAGMAEAIRTLERVAETLSSRPPDEADNLLLLCRVLFVPRRTDEIPPPLRLGAPDPPEPAVRADFPFFPVEVTGDLPFILVIGYQLAGQPEPPDAYLRWCAARAEARAPLAPVPDPLAVADDLIASDPWRRLRPQADHDRMLRRQAWRAVSSVVPMPPDASPEPGDPAWEEARRRVRSAALEWDDASGDFRPASQGVDGG